MHRLLAALLTAAALALLAAGSAGAASRFVIRGAGYGHGIGMSQWGADGYAQHGEDYRFILSHFYTGTSLADVSPVPDVGVLLRSAAKVSFTGATSAAGRTLRADRTYSVSRAGASVVKLLSPSGRKLATYDGALRVTGPGPLTLRGTAGNGVRDGQYRGALEFRPGLFGGVNAINVVDLEDYVRGVVASESPSTWPAEALKAQAVAARSYAVTTDAGTPSDGFTQYPDTRSQVYRGVAGETPTSDAAVAATAHEVVTYGGRPVTTYFFSSSGGETENVENVFAGALPRPWLKGVNDPYDTLSPRHRWGPLDMTLRQAGARLRGLVKGSFRGIDVLQRGVSPRIVAADVVGTGGRTRVSGSELRSRLGLWDSWAYFKVITSKGQLKAPSARTPAPPAATGDPTTGGTPPSATAARAARPVIVGRVAPFRVGAWIRIQQLVDGTWQPSTWAVARHRGRYATSLPGPGTYRVLYRGETGPAVTVP